MSTLFSALQAGFRRCANGFSVPDRHFCNNIDDCFDNSDETAEECKSEYRVIEPELGFII